MRGLILIKLGGSIITDKGKPFTAREREIKRFGKEILDARRRYKGDLIIGHGSGSFGHSVAEIYKTKEGFLGKKSIEGLSLVSDAAVQINRIVICNLLKVGLPVVSFAPASFIYSKREKTKTSLISPIKQAIHIGIVPVIYGDVVFDKDMGFCIYSGEKILNLLAVGLKNWYKEIKIIYCGDTDGVYDESRKTIPKITPTNFHKYKKNILGSGKVDVTGGMLHKVEESLKIAKSLGVKTWIINGNKKRNLKKAILGRLTPETTVISSI